MDMTWRKCISLLNLNGNDTLWVQMIKNEMTKKVIINEGMALKFI